MEVILSIGGNQGNVRENICNAVALLNTGGLLEIKLSPLYRTSPIDCATGTDDFINAAIAGKWHGTPKQLLALCRKIEAAAGRPSVREKNASRPLDIDVVLCDDLVSNDPELILPHPRAQERLFVLMPTNDIAPDMVFPDSGLSIGAQLHRVLQTLPSGEQAIEKL